MGNYIIRVDKSPEHGVIIPRVEVVIPVFGVVIIPTVAERVRSCDRRQAAAVFKEAVRSVDVFADDISRRVEQLHHVALQVINVEIYRAVGVPERHALSVLVVIEDLRRIRTGLLREDLRPVQEKLRRDAVDGFTRPDPVGDSVRFYISY